MKMRQTSLSKYLNLVWFCFSFIGGGNRRTRRKPPTCRKSLSRQKCLFEYISDMILWQMC